MTFLESIKTVYAKYATFSGRATRSEFWWFTLFVYIVVLSLSLIFAAIGNEGLYIPLIVLLGIFLLISFIPILALRVRRLHDIGKSGWWILFGFIPYLGGLILFIFALMKSEGENEYGPNPFE